MLAQEHIDSCETTTKKQQLLLDQFEVQYPEMLESEMQRLEAKRRMEGRAKRILGGSIYSWSIFWRLSMLLVHLYV